MLGCNTGGDGGICLAKDKNIVMLLVCRNYWQLSPYEFKQSIHMWKAEGMWALCITLWFLYWQIIGPVVIFQVIFVLTNSPWCYCKLCCLCRISLGFCCPYCLHRWINMVYSSLLVALLFFFFTVVLHFKRWSCDVYCGWTWLGI